MENLLSIYDEYIKNTHGFNELIIWQISPGRYRDKLWPEFRNNNIIGMGWDELGDLNQYKSKLEIEEALRSTFPDYYTPNKKPLNDINSCWYFSHQIEIGDIVVAKYGHTKKIYGIGKVIKPYNFDTSREYYKHIRGVKWYITFDDPIEVNVTSRFVQWTVNSLSSEKFNQTKEFIINNYPEYKNTFNLLLTESEKVEKEVVRAYKYSIDDFESETGFSKKEITNWELILRRKKQIIFQGPPGTGKTYVAERLAKMIVSETHGFWEIIQFHSAYNYEDFIQGLQPKPIEGILQFQLIPGRFLQFCERVRATAEGAPCILIIDEINRANLARVFGELMYLLEYRDKAIPLAVGGEPFQIPTNVYIIGTMNTADRSIALVDYALRRRFSFIRLKPKYDILKKALEVHDLPIDDLIAVLKEINQAIDDPNYEIGISFFMKEQEHLKELLPSIWISEIEPYLEEYFYDQPGKVRTFRWDTLSNGKMSSWAE